MLCGCVKGVRCLVYTLFPAAFRKSGWALDLLIWSDTRGNKVSASLAHVSCERARGMILYRCATTLFRSNLHIYARARALACVRVRYLCRLLLFQTLNFFYSCILFSVCAYALIYMLKNISRYVVEHINLFVLSAESVYLCSIKHKRYKIMKAIVVTYHVYKNVKFAALFERAARFYSSVRVDSASNVVYLYFGSDFHLTTISSSFFVAGILHRVTLI